ncbi:unnamed protein product [Rhizophagus irregularis]|nr:unnamed protein product [Rhizophagus irregularis]
MKRDHFSRIFKGKIYSKTFGESSMNKNEKYQHVLAASKNLTSEVSASSKVAAVIDLELIQPTEGINKRKKSKEFSDLTTKCFKLNTNTQSIIEKILKEQLKQSAEIDTLRNEVSENHKLLDQKCFYNIYVRIID